MNPVTMMRALIRFAPLDPFQLLRQAVKFLLALASFGLIERVFLVTQPAEVPVEAGEYQDGLKVGGRLAAPARFCVRRFTAADHRFRPAVGEAGEIDLPGTYAGAFPIDGTNLTAPAQNVVRGIL